MRRQKPLRLCAEHGRGHRRDCRLHGRNARGHGDHRDVASVTALDRRMLQIPEAFDEAKTPDLYLQIPPAGSAARLASSQSCGLGGPRRGGLPDHDVAFAGPSTQIEEDPHRVKQSRFRCCATKGPSVRKRSLDIARNRPTRAMSRSPLDRTARTSLPRADGRQLVTGAHAAHLIDFEPPSAPFGLVWVAAATNRPSVVPDFNRLVGAGLVLRYLNSLTVSRAFDLRALTGVSLLVLITDAQNGGLSYAAMIAELEGALDALRRALG